MMMVTDIMTIFRGSLVGGEKLINRLFFNKYVYLYIVRFNMPSCVFLVQS